MKSGRLLIVSSIQMKSWSNAWKLCRHDDQKDALLIILNSSRRSAECHGSRRRELASVIFMKTSSVAPMSPEQKMREVEVVSLYVFLTDVSFKFVIYRPLVALTVFAYIYVRWMSISSRKIKPRMSPRKCQRHHFNGFDHPASFHSQTGGADFQQKPSALWYLIIPILWNTQESLTKL